MRKGPVLNDFELKLGALSLVGFVEEYPFFRDEVIPRLEAKGLREPVAGLRASSRKALIGF